jgi:hypothetical protein
MHAKLKLSLCSASQHNYKMAAARKYPYLVHALPVIAAVLAVAFFVPRSSNRSDGVINAAPNAEPAPTVREAPSTAEEGLINWATDHGAKVSFKFSRQIFVEANPTAAVTVLNKSK